MPNMEAPGLFDGALTVFPAAGNGAIGSGSGTEN